MAGPRIVLVSLQYYLARSSSSSIPTIVFIFGIIRTLSCGGWVYITSSDDHDLHDFFMLTYIVCNIPWMIGGIWCTPTKFENTRRKRLVSPFQLTHFVTLLPRRSYVAAAYGNRISRVVNQNLTSNSVFLRLFSPWFGFSFNTRCTKYLGVGTYSSTDSSLI